MMGALLRVLRAFSARDRSFWVLGCKTMVHIVSAGERQRGECENKRADGWI